MTEQEIQAQKIEAKYNFRVVDKIDFNEAIHLLKKELALIHHNEVVYYKILSSGVVVGKNNLSTRTFYLTK